MIYVGGSKKSRGHKTDNYNKVESKNNIICFLNWSCWTLTVLGPCLAWHGFRMEPASTKVMRTSSSLVMLASSLGSSQPPTKGVPLKWTFTGQQEVPTLIPWIFISGGNWRGLCIIPSLMGYCGSGRWASTGPSSSPRDPWSSPTEMERWCRWERRGSLSKVRIEIIFFSM